jgi:hypothetical protein
MTSPTRNRTTYKGWIAQHNGVDMSPNYVPMPHDAEDQSVFRNDPYEEDAIVIENADGEKDTMSVESWRHTALRLLPFTSIPSMVANIWMALVQIQTLRKVGNSGSPPRGLFMAWSLLIFDIGLFSKIHRYDISSY